jgi:hypothetical protein
MALTSEFDKVQEKKPFSSPNRHQIETSTKPSKTPRSRRFKRKQPSIRDESISDPTYKSVLNASSAILSKADMSLLSRGLNFCPTPQETNEQHNMKDTRAFFHRLRLIDWLFTVLHPARVFHFYRDVTIAGEGLQNLGLCSAFMGFWARRDLYRATPILARGLGFCGLIRRTAPFSRHLRHTSGCGESILSRILTGFRRLRLKEHFLRQARMTNICTSCHPLHTFKGVP